MVFTRWAVCRVSDDVGQCLKTVPEKDMLPLRERHFAKGCENAIIDLTTLARSKNVLSAVSMLSARLSTSPGPSALKTCWIALKAAIV